MFGCFLLLRDGAQHVARPRNMREIDLGFDFVFGVSGGGARRPCRTRAGLGAGAKMLADEFSFVFLQRTRVRLLLGDTHRGQHVKNLLALDFQFTGQIIDSNLHPLWSSFSGPARLTTHDSLRSNLYARISTSRNPCRSTARLAKFALSVWTMLQTRRIPQISSTCLPELLLPATAPLLLLRPAMVRLLRTQPFRQARVSRLALPLCSQSPPALLHRKPLQVQQERQIPRWLPLRRFPLPQQRRPRRHPDWQNNY